MIHFLRTKDNNDLADIEVYSDENKILIIKVFIPVTTYSIELLSIPEQDRAEFIAIFSNIQNIPQFFGDQKGKEGKEFMTLENANEFVQNILRNIANRTPYSYVVD